MIFLLLALAKTVDHEIELSSSSKRELKFKAGDSFKLELPAKKIIDIIFYFYDDSAIDMDVQSNDGTKTQNYGKFSSQSYLGYHSVMQKTIFQGKIKSDTAITIYTRIYPVQCNDYFYSTSPNDYFYIDSKPNGKCNLTLREDTYTCFLYAPGSYSEGRVRYSVPLINSFMRFFVNDEMSEAFRTSGEFAFKELENPLFVFRYGPDIMSIIDAFHPMMEIRQKSKSTKYHSFHIDNQKSQFILLNDQIKQIVPDEPKHPEPAPVDPPRPVPTVAKVPTRSNIVITPTKAKIIIPTKSNNPVDNNVGNVNSKIEKDDVKMLALAITFGTIGSVLVIGLLVLIGFLCYQKMKTPKYGALRNRLDEENVQIFDPQYYQPPAYPVDPYYPRYQFERNY